MVFIDGISYDFTKFNHPGGNDIIRLFTKDNQDADITLAYISNHSRKFNHNKYAHLCKKTFYEGKQIYYADYTLLIDKVNKELPPQYRKAPIKYYIKITIILFFTFYLTYNLYHSWNLRDALILAWLHALIGLNIQHDANHGSVSKYTWINVLLGYTQNLIGGSREIWIYKHMVRHHVHTNNHIKDVDNDGRGILKLNQKSPDNPIIKYQWIYGILGLPFFAYDIIINETFKCVRKLYLFSILTKAIYIYIHIVNPIKQNPTLFRCLETQIPIMFTGGYLAFFFILSHNYIGVRTNSDDYKNITFLQHQIESSSNVGGKILCEFNGGLNYQIEHHLFPKIHHAHYPKLSLIIKSFCKEQGYKYVHFNSLITNIKSTMMHLWIMGNINFDY